MFMFESQLVQMPGPRDIILYWPGTRAFSVVQKPRGWAHILVQKPRGARGGMVTGQIDTCIISFIGTQSNVPRLVARPTVRRQVVVYLVCDVHAINYMNLINLWVSSTGRSFDVISFLSPTKRANI